MKKIVLPLLLISLLITQAVAQDVGDPAPDFSFDDYTGNTFTLSDHKGKVVFIFTFGNTCPSCLGFGNQTETKVNEVYGNRDDFVAVGVDTWNSSSSNTSVEQFASQTGIEYPLLVKGGDMAVEYETTYDRLLVVDKEGILRHKGTTLATNDLDNAINVIEEYLEQMATNLKEEILLKHRIYPVPAKENLSFEFTLGERSYVSFSIFNALGEKLNVEYSGSFSAGLNQKNFDVSSLKSGIYFYRLKVDNERFVTGKFSVKH